MRSEGQARGKIGHSHCADDLIGRAQAMLQEMSMGLGVIGSAQGCR